MEIVDRIVQTAQNSINPTISFLVAQQLNELRFSNNFVEKRSSSFLKALRNQDFLSRTLLCIGLKSLKLQNEYFYDSA